MFGILEKVTKTLALLAGRLDPATYGPADAARVIQALVRIEKLVVGMRIRLSAQVDAEGLFGAEGDRSASDWLGKATGQSSAEAQRDIDCAKQLRDLPDTERAVADGELSGTQVKEVADAASKDRTAEQQLLDTAKRRSVHELKRDAKRVKASAMGDDQARHEHHDRTRSLRFGSDETGGFWGHITSTGDRGARFAAALQPYVDKEFERARREGRRPSQETLRHDALMAMVLGAADDRPPARSAKPKLIGSFDVPAIIRGHTESGERCEIAGIGPVPVAAMRALLPEAALHLILRDGQDAFNVTSLARHPNVMQQTVLQWLGIACRVDGCPCTEHLQIDHDIEWHRIQVTELANLDWLCKYHHDRKTLDGWRLEPGTGKRRFLSPEEQAHAPPAA